MNPSRKLLPYLLILLTLFYAAGIICSRQGNISAPFLLTSILVLSFAGICCYRRALFLCLGFLLAGVFFFGLMNGRQSARLPDTPGHISHLIQGRQETVVIGCVRRTYAYNRETSRFDMQAIGLRHSDSSYSAVNGVIRFTIRDRLPQIVVPGAPLAVRGILDKPHRTLTPGSFDYPAYLASRNIYVTGRITSPLHIHTATLPQKLQLAGLPVTIEKWRHRINTFLDMTLEPQSAAIYKALLTGDRSGISPQIIELFTASGCLHLLAISGLHISLLALVCYTCIFWLLRRFPPLLLRINSRKTAMLITILPLLLYTLLAGSKAPVMRALIMGSLAFAAFCSDRKPQLLPLISCAALLLLVTSPQMLFEASFQLTFAAMIAIATVLPLIRSVREKISGIITPRPGAFFLNTVATSILISTTATIGTAPILLYHFNRVSIAGILLNIIIEPILCFWSLLFGLAGLFVLPVLPTLSRYLFIIGGRGIDLSVWLLQLCQSPHTFFYLPTPSYPVIILFFAGFLLFFRARRSLRICGAGISAAAVFLFFHPFPGLFDTDKNLLCQTAFLDTGHGGCNVIHLPRNNITLIDAGSLSSSPRYDTGKNVIAPYLWHTGIHSIENIIITHPDADHYNGLPFLLRHFHVKKLWISSPDGNSAWTETISLARRRNVQVTVAEKGARVIAESSTRLSIIANTASANYPPSHNNGLVIKLVSGGVTVLFPGDIENMTEEQLVREKTDLAADILLAPHHGSKTSVNRSFLEAVNPEYVIVPAERNGNGKFPSAALLQYCREMKIRLLQTGKDGTVLLEIQRGNKTGYKISTPFSEESANQTSVKSFGALRRYLTNLAFSMQFE